MSDGENLRQRNQRGEGSKLREELIQAAMRILDRAPASALSMRMVAREAGVAAPSVYAHFADAESLMVAIVRECWSQLGDAMTQSAALVDSDDPFRTLKAEMSAYVRYAMDRPSRYQLLYAFQPIEPERFSDLPGLLRPAYRNVLTCITQLAAQGVKLPAQERRDCDADDHLPRAWAHCVGASCAASGRQFAGRCRALRA